MVEVRWREPATSNGIIEYYTVYASAEVQIGIGIVLVPSVVTIGTKVSTPFLLRLLFVCI